jgi:hypothetical protein
VVLIWISFMAMDGEHFFMCFLAIWKSSNLFSCPLLYWVIDLRGV